MAISKTTPVFLALLIPGLIYAQTLQLEFSSYLGGAKLDGPHAITVDGAGAVYVAGNTFSYDFPIEGDAYQTSYSGGGGGSDYSDAFVSKFSADGSSLIWSTYLGDDVDEGGISAQAIAVDSNGIVYLTGNTASTNYPVTVGAFQSTNAGNEDVFVAKLSADGSTLLYSTFLGGRDTEQGQGICFDADGYIYVTGYTGSTNFPVTPSAYQTERAGSSYNRDAFVSKFSADGSSLIYSTYVGGSDSDYGEGICLDSSSCAHIAGYTESSNFPIAGVVFQSTNAGQAEAFVTKLSVNGTSLEYSTYLGGSEDDWGLGIAIENDEVYVAGFTCSSNFPSTNGYQSTWSEGYDSSTNAFSDAFVSKLANGATSLVYSTFLGGTNEDCSYGISVEDGCAYIAGYTESKNFPVKNAYQTTLAGMVENEDSFVSKLSASGSGLVYSTYLGGTGRDWAEGVYVHDGAVYMCGYTESTNFPTTASAYQTSGSDIGLNNGDGFVSELVLPSAGDLQFVDIYMLGSQVGIEWTGGQDTTQYLMRTDSLLLTNWSCVATASPPLDPTNFFVDNYGGTQAFYRVQAEE